MSVFARFLGGQAARQMQDQSQMPQGPQAGVPDGMGAYLSAVVPDGFSWDTYLVGGGTRPDAISGLADPFEGALATMISAAPPEIQKALRVSSGYRSEQRQAELWQEALAKYGSPEAARKWVAPPGKSKHNHGSAVDLRYLSPEAERWAHQNANRFGLHFPMSWEPWHIEPMGSRGPMAGYVGAGQ